MILGVDPGYGILGYGLLSKVGNRIEYVHHGFVKTPKNLSLPERLLRLYTEFERVLDEYRPDEGAVEKLFFVKNVTNALEVGHARGVVLLQLARRRIPVYEYTPQQVKISVVGYGKASKRQVQEMVKRLLRLKDIPKPDDSADALAVAWCHALYRRG